MALDSEDSIYDYILLGWLLFVTGVLIATLILVVIKRPTFASLRYKQPYYLYGNIVFGLVAIWASFVSNDHFSALDPVRQLNCGLWSYWLSHVFGVNMWFTLIMLRFVDKMFIFHQSLSSLQQTLKTVIKISVFFMLITFPVMLASHVSFFRLSYYSDEAHSCTSILNVKLLLIAWYTVCYVAMSITFLYLERDIHNIYFNEYLSMNHIVGVAQYVFLTNICVNLFGVVQYDYGRFIYTFNISLLFLFTTLRLCGYALYKALTNDRLYDETIVKNFIAYDLKYLSLRELIPCETLMDGYIEFVRQRHASNHSQAFQFENLISCVRKIGRVDASRNPLKKKQAILNKFFVAECLFNLRLDDDKRQQVYKTGDLSLGRRYILEKLDHEFYGVEYLKMLNSDDMLNELAPYIKIRLNKRKVNNHVETNATPNSHVRDVYRAQEINQSADDDVNDNSANGNDKQQEDDQYDQPVGNVDDLEMSVIDIHSNHAASKGRSRELRHKAMHLTDDMVADLNNQISSAHGDEEDIVSMTDSEELNPYEDFEYDDEDRAPPYNIAIRDHDQNLIISTGPTMDNNNNNHSSSNSLKHKRKSSYHYIPPPFEDTTDKRNRNTLDKQSTTDDDEDLYDERQRISFLTGEAKKAFTKTLRENKKKASIAPKPYATVNGSTTSTSSKIKKLKTRVKDAFGTIRTKIAAVRQPYVEHI